MVIIVSVTSFRLVLFLYFGQKFRYKVQKYNVRTKNYRYILYARMPRITGVLRTTEIKKVVELNRKGLD